MRTQGTDERFYISIENNFSFALVMCVCDWLTNFAPCLKSWKQNSGTNRNFYGPIYSCIYVEGQLSLYCYCSRYGVSQVGGSRLAWQVNS